MKDIRQEKRYFKTYIETALKYWGTSSIQWNHFGTEISSTGAGSGWKVCILKRSLEDVKEEARWGANWEAVQSYMTSRNALCCCPEVSGYKPTSLTLMLNCCCCATLMLNCKMVDLWFSRRGGQYWQLVLALKANKGDRGFLSMLSKEASHKLVGCMI